MNIYSFLHVLFIFTLMGIHFFTKLSCNLLDLNFERASTLNGLALSMSPVIDKLEVDYQLIIKNIIPKIANPSQIAII